MTNATIEKPAAKPRKARAADPATSAPPADAQTSILEPEADVVTLSKVAVYNPIEQGIKLMLDKHGYMLTAPPVINGDVALLEKLKKDRGEMVKFRTGLERVRKEEKADALSYCNLVDSEARRIQSIATPIENAYDKVIQVEDDRLETIRLENEAKDRLRVKGHLDRIQLIKDVRETATLCRTADRIQSLIDELPGMFAGDFQEFQEDAQTAYDQTLAMLTDLHTRKVAAEKEAADLLEQQEQLRLQKEQLDAKQAETDRLAAIKTKTDAIRELRFDAATADTAADVQALLQKLEGLKPDDSFGDHKALADEVFTATKAAIELVHTNKVRSEALAEELAEHTRQQAATAAQQVQAAAPAPAPAAEPAAAPAAPAASVDPEPDFTLPPVGDSFGGSVTKVFNSPPCAGYYRLVKRRFDNDLAMDRPTNAAILGAIGDFFNCDEDEAMAWVRDVVLTTESQS